MKHRIFALLLCMALLLTLVAPAYAADETVGETALAVTETTVSESTVSESTDVTDAPTADVTTEPASDPTAEPTTEAPTSEPTAPPEPATEPSEPEAPKAPECNCTPSLGAEEGEVIHQPGCPLYVEPEQIEQSDSASFSDLPQEMQETILAMIRRQEGLDGIMMFAAEEPVSIDGKWFVVYRDSESSVSPTQSIPSGKITAAGVPDLTGEGYTFVGAFYRDIPVLRVGQIEYNRTVYVYYVTEGSNDNLVAMVLGNEEQIQLRYKKNPVNITYAVTGGQTQADGSITVSGIPYGQTAQGTVTVIPADNPDTVFPGDEYAFTVEIPRGYSATVSVNGVVQSPTLGVSPTYHRDGNSVVKDDNSAAYLHGYTYTVNNVDGTQNVVVTLNKDNSHSFSATLISQTAYFGSGLRANSQVNNRSEWLGTVNAGGSLTWTLTTTTYEANWEMDSLQMNGTDLRVPFVNGKTETTVLPSGTTVSISRAYAKKLFGGYDTNRFVYTITLSKCYENVVVTGGNLRGRDHSEYIPYEFTGVESFQYKKGNNWVDGYISQPIGAIDVNGAFRFKLLPGYGTPTLTLKRSDEAQTVQETHTPSLGADGYYTVNFSTNGLNYPALIVIEAETINVSVKYLPGTVSAAQMPVDNNQYSLSGKKEVLIPLAVPADPDGKMVFTGWENGGKNYGPNTLVPLEELQADGGTISFTAQWKDVESAEQITYSIQIKDEDGNILESTTSQAPSDTALILDVNSPTIVEWLTQHPEYEVDTENTTFYYESIKNGDVVELIVKEKKATITYVAVGPDDETGFGSVDSESEVIKVKTGAAQGSDAEAGTNFRFMGWFDNADCTGDPISEYLHYTPLKSGNLWEDATYYAKFDYALADLTISKTVESNRDDKTPDEEFHFTLNLSGAQEGQGFPVEKTSAAGNGEAAAADIEEITSSALIEIGEDGGANFSFNLKAGETLTIRDLPVDVTYTVTEQTDNMGYGFSFKGVKVNDGPASTNPVTTGTVGVNGSTVEFTNLFRLYDLTINKTVSGGLEPNQSFVFNVTGPNGMSMDVVINGTGSITVSDLIPGKYMVTEEQNWAWRYSGGSQSADLTSGSGSVNFNNSVNNPYWLNGCDYAKNEWPK